MSHSCLKEQRLILISNLIAPPSTKRQRCYLDDLAKALKDNPELQIKLVGHTDNIGSEKFNLKLSQYRAQTMKDYLVSKGVAAARISVEGKGMKEPLNDNSTDAKRALNRRVELTIITSRKF